MAITFNIKADVAFGSIMFNPIQEKGGILLNADNIPEYNIPTKLADFFSLRLTNKMDKVFVKGVFVISTGDDRSCTTDSKLAVGIEIYRDFDRSILAYKNNSVLVGVQQKKGPKIQWEIPVQFDDSPLLKSTEDTVSYFVTIVVNQSATSINPHLELVQYLLVGVEV